MSATTPPPVKSVLVLSFGTSPREAVLRYVGDLIADGVSVDLVVLDAARWRDDSLESTLPEAVRIHEIRRAESGLFTQRAKRLLIYRIPKRSLRASSRATSRTRFTRPLAGAIRLADKAHRRLARIAEHRIFSVYNRFGRPLRLARAADRALRNGAIDFGNVGRIVSTETYSIPYAWRLSKRLPNVPITTSLDRSPLVGSTSGGSPTGPVRQTD